jgi:hypothetical protein
MLGAWHDESLRAADLLVEALDVRRGIFRSNKSPQFGPEADDEVHASRGHARFTDRGERRGKLAAFLRIHEVELQVGVRGGAKGKYSGLMLVHAEIISAPLHRSERPDGFRERLSCGG